MQLPVPFKCPGGKRNLINKLEEVLPKEFNLKKGQYIEPFAGGAALALYLANKFISTSNLIPSSAPIHLNDSNPYIYNLLLAIKTDPTQLAQEFDLLATKFKATEKELFLKLRVALDIPSIAYNTQPDYLQAAIFLFLTKNCFNGLIRFNKSGAFNSPYGKYKKVQTYNLASLHKLNKLFSLTTIEALDFEQFSLKILNSIKTKKSNLFFYFDPPYAPLSTTSKFTEYTSGGFSTYDQFRLKSLIDYLTHIGVKIMLSNSASTIVNKLYKDYNIKEIKALRIINSKVTNRGAISEYIITNY